MGTTGWFVAIRAARAAQHPTKVENQRSAPVQSWRNLGAQWTRHLHLCTVFYDRRSFAAAGRLRAPR